MQEARLGLDLGGPRPRQLKHERLKAQLVGEIVAGRLKPGDFLPSENQLAKELGITRVTVRRAMASMENEGLIRRVQGKGTFVESDAWRKLHQGLDIFALVVPVTREGFYPALLHGFETAAADLRHQTIVCSTDDNVERQADIILQLVDKNVGGVAINPTSPEPTPAYQVRLLHKQGIPVVFCHRRVEGVAAPLLAIPFREVGRVAGRALVERGHRRVAFMATYRYSASQACEEGLNEVLMADGNNPPVETVFASESGVPQEEAVMAALQQVFAKPDRPTAIYASFDSLAETIYLLLPRLGLRVPEDVSLLGFGGAWRQGALMKRLSSVVVDEVALGQRAVSLLHEMRRGERPIDDNTELTMDVGFSEGETLSAEVAEAEEKRGRSSFSGAWERLE